MKGTSPVLAVHEIISQNEHGLTVLVSDEQYI